MRYEETPSAGLAIKIWWALTWRTFLIGMAILLPLIFISAIVFASMGLGKEQAVKIINLLTTPVLIPVTIYVIYRMTTKGFGRYRLTAMEK